MARLQKLMRILLGVTLLVGITFLVIQFFLIEPSVEQDKSNSPTYLNQQAVLASQDYDFTRCQALLKQSQFLNDIQSYQEAYRRTLNNLEDKHTEKLRLIDSLETKIQAKKNQLASLKNKEQNLKEALLVQLLQKSELEEKIKDFENKLKEISVEVGYFEKINVNSAISLCNASTGDYCFNYQRCQDHFNVHIFNRPYSLNKSLESSSLHQSISFVSNINISCLTLVFLDQTLDIYRLRTQILENDYNFLFIEYTHNLDSFTNGLLSANPVINSNQIKSLQIKIKHSLFASFYNPVAQFKFSPLSQSDYLPSLNTLPTIIRNYTSERPFLINFLVDHSDTNNTLSPIYSILSLFKHSGNDIDFSCKKCENQTERINRLSQAKFTLILTDSSGSEWTQGNLFRLLEALKTATIPVVLGMNKRMPLDELIAWSEIILQIPISKAGRLNIILQEISSNDLLLPRQIKAVNVYRNYFSSDTVMLKTLLAAVQWQLGLDLKQVDSLKLEEINLSECLERDAKSSLKKPDNAKLNLKENSYDDDDENYFDGEMDENEEDEYIGPTDQKPISNLNFRSNSTRDKYNAWNTYYQPFNNFPATSLDNKPVLQDTYFRTVLKSKNTEVVEDTEDVSLLHDYTSLTNHTLGGSDGHFFHHHLSGNHPIEQFTIIILTYKRETLLTTLLDSYLHLSHLHSILVVWNDYEGNPSPNFCHRFRLYQTSGRLRIIRSKSNSLTNRFLPYTSIVTDALLSLDDDVLLTPAEIDFAFRTWRQNRHLLVGFPARNHVWHIPSQSFIYHADLACEYSLILTGAAFFHRFYTNYFFMTTDHRITEKIDKLGNCEDIAFNFMIAHVTRQPPLKVTARFSFGSGGAKEIALSDRYDHYKERNDCVDYFVSIYGYNPLLYSQYRADSVLFQTRVSPNIQKCYRYV